MANYKTIQIDSQIYTLKQFANAFKLSYSTVRKYYAKGYRDSKLLQLVTQKTRKSYKYKGIVFQNRHQAASFLKIPRATLYKKSNQGTLGELIPIEGR